MLREGVAGVTLEERHVGWVALALGRPEHLIPLEEPLTWLRSQTVLVTGGRGSVGQALTGLLEQAGIDAVATDVDDLDVRQPVSLGELLPEMTVIFHLAGAKHADDGEADPEQATLVNTIGTRNMVATGRKVVLASTCKAADPETAYGASKLIAERLVLNAGGTVARFYNVVESSGNVFATWDGLPQWRAVPVTPCSRYLISLREAVALLVWAAFLPCGRYTINPGEPQPLIAIARRVYPARRTSLLFPRRGDRLVEPRHAACEWTYQPRPDIPALEGLASPHDP